jgi:thiol:disulfide interchange protein
VAAAANPLSFNLMRFFSFILIGLLGLAQPVLAAPHSQVDLVNLSSKVIAGEKITLALRFKCDPHYHIYWKNPGDAGTPPSINWTDKAGTEPGPLLWPGPTLLDLNGVINFIHADESLLLIETTVPKNSAQEITLKGHVQWLECNEGGCYPQEKDVSLTLKMGVDAKAVSFNSKLYGELQPILNFSGQISNQTLTVESKGEYPQTWFPEKNFISPSAAAKQTSSVQQKTFSLADATESLTSDSIYFVTADRNGGFRRIHIDLANKAVSPSSSKATLPPTGLNWGTWSPDTQAAALAAGKTVYLDFTARWCATCQVNKRVYHQSAVINALSQSNIVLLRADWTKKDPVIAQELKKYGREGIPFNVLLKPNQPPIILSELLTGTEIVNSLNSTPSPNPTPFPTSTHSYLVWLLFAFGGGMLLNLMPCVFPMLGLKVLGFAQESGAARRTVIIHGLLYTLGVIISFLSLALLIVALKSSGNSIGWGFQMQSPGFVLLTCILMITLGLSLVGVFEIGTSLAGRAGQLENRATSTGAILSGMLATAVATPCTAPGLGAALGFALESSRTTSETLLFFFIIGLGMATPYLVLSLFPKLTRLLPKPGAWMETLKQVMSFPLFAYAIYLLWVLYALVDEPTWLRDVSLGLILVALACWVFGHWGALHRTPKQRFLGRLTALIIFVTTVGYLLSTLP